MLEFICALQSEHLTPEKLFHELEHNHLLLIGSDFSNWLARLFLRMAKRKRLSDPRDVGEVLADDHTMQDERLVAFLQQVSVRTRVYGGAEAFVAELHARWMKRQGGAPTAAGAAADPAALPAAVARDAGERDLHQLCARGPARGAAAQGGDGCGGPHDLVRPRPTRGRRRLRPQDPRQHRALQLLRAGDLGDDAAPARGLFPPRVELRGRPLAQHRRGRGVHPAGVHRRHARGGSAGAGEVPGAAHDAPARRRTAARVPAPPQGTLPAGAAHERQRSDGASTPVSDRPRAPVARPVFLHGGNAGLFPRPRRGGRRTRAPRPAQEPHRAVRPVRPRQDVAAARGPRAAAARRGLSARSTCASTTRPSRRRPRSRSSRPSSARRAGRALDATRARRSKASRCGSSCTTAATCCATRAAARCCRC